LVLAGSINLAASIRPKYPRKAVNKYSKTNTNVTEIYSPERVFISDSQPEIYKFFTRKYYKEHVSNTKFYRKKIKLDGYFMEQLASSSQK